MAILLDGRTLAKEIRITIKHTVEEIQRNHGFTPGLAVVLVGENLASQSYIRSKTRACKKTGIYSRQIDLPASITEKELLDHVNALNEDPEIHGILVQLPLPKHIDEQKVIAAINPHKDADGFHPVSMGKLLIGLDTTIPCTPYGIMKLLEHYQIEFSGKHAVVLGRSNIVGKPISLLLQAKNATVTMCHSKTRDLPDIVKSADILVAAIGKERFVKGDWLKKEAVVVDVGMNTDKSGNLCGDVDFENAQHVAYITPVPGGIGPLTVTMLLQNTLTAALHSVL